MSDIIQKQHLGFFGMHVHVNFSSDKRGKKSLCTYPIVLFPTSYGCLYYLFAKCFAIHCPNIDIVTTTMKK